MLTRADSPSSRTSLSRPTTPSHQYHQCMRSRTSNSPPPEPFALAHKAERILGLTPGTLPHAQACLENARDEIRRTASPPPVSMDASSSTNHTNASHSTTGFNFSTGTTYSSANSTHSPTPPVGGMRGRIDRAKKAMSVALPTGQGRPPSVVVGIGGKDEEEKRERRRRAADGVLYWQKEVARLQAEQSAAMATIKKR